MTIKFKTNYTFKGNRDYVHSTTILEELSRQVYKNYSSEKEWHAPKVDAKFHRPILFNGCFQISEHKNCFPEYDNVAAEFRFYDSRHNITAIFIEDKNEAVTKRIKTNYSVESVVIDGDYSGTCMIGCSNANTMIENIIEANKKIHKMTLKNRNSLRVVNLYMKKLPVSLPASGMPDSGKLQLKIENIGIRTLDDSVATLNSLSFPETSMDSFELSYVVYWK